MKLLSAIADFLNHAEIGKGQSLRTIRNYTHYLGRFRAFAGDIDVEDITQELINSFRLSLNRLEAKDGTPLLSRTTQNYHIIALRAFMKYLIKNDYNVIAPDKIDVMKTESTAVAFLERAELESLLDAVDTSTKLGIRDRTIMEMLFSTGLRVSELAGLNWQDIALERGEFPIRGKGRKVRIVFLSKRCQEWLHKHLKENTADSPFLFCGARGTKLTATSIEVIVRKYNDIAGTGKKVSPHTLRHTLATELLRNGADIRYVQEFLGHASIATTQRYAHVTNSRLREIHGKFLV